jgi:hypothetical protein
MPRSFSVLSLVDSLERHRAEGIWLSIACRTSDPASRHLGMRVAEQTRRCSSRRGRVIRVARTCVTNGQRSASTCARLGQRSGNTPTILSELSARRRHHPTVRQPSTTQDLTAILPTNNPRRTDECNPVGPQNGQRAW